MIPPLDVRWREPLGLPPHAAPSGTPATPLILLHESRLRRLMLDTQRSRIRAQRASRFVFGAQRSALGARRSALGAWRSPSSRPFLFLSLATT